MAAHSALDADEARYRLYQLMAADEPFEEKAEQALALGEEILGVDNGHMARIEPDTNFWKAIVSTDSPDGQFPPNTVHDLEETFCRRAIAQADSLILHDAPEQGWADDPAYLEHQINCYHGTPITVDGEPYGTVCFVSEQSRGRTFDPEETMFAELIARMLEHELEKQRAQNRIDRLDQFAAAVSHDLRNPLNVAQLQVETERSQHDSENLQQAAGALDRMERLISDVLSIARQAETVDDPEQVSLETAATESWENVTTPNSDLVVESSMTFLADPDRLQRLFENLFRNSVEHGSTSNRLTADDSVEHGSTSNRLTADDSVEHTGPVVTVRVGELEDDLGFYVADDGPGIPEAERETVFESGYSDGERGIGLGLAIVEGVATAHEWSIDLTESASGGARFDLSGVVVSSWGS